MAVFKNFIPTGTVNIAATVASATVALSPNPLNRKDVMVHNSGTTLCFIKFGGPTITAAITDTPIPAGSFPILHANNETHVAVIMLSGAATVYFTSGNGN
jgi:hypothetical protein